MNTGIRIENIDMSYGNQKNIFSDFSLSLVSNEITCILGPSGGGKSTLLHLLAGFIRPTSGKIFIDDTLICNPSPKRGVVFQKHNLFPWKTVLQNICLGPEIRGEDKGTTVSTAVNYLEKVGLPDCAHKYPHELSFGMQQRVGIARAFANNPDILLMDEPFGALDAQTRLRVQHLLLEILGKNSKTIVFVTHDIEEAIFISNRILVFNNSPVAIVADIINPLPYPRSYEQITSPAATVLRKNIFDLLL